MEAIGEWKRAGREFVVATQRRLAAARTCNPNEVRQVRVAAAAKGGDESELTTAFSKDLFETTLRGLLPKLVSDGATASVTRTPRRPTAPAKPPPADAESPGFATFAATGGRKREKAPAEESAAAREERLRSEWEGLLFKERAEYNKKEAAAAAAYAAAAEAHAAAVQAHEVTEYTLRLSGETAVGRALRLPPDGFTGFEFLSVAGREVRKAHFTELKCKFDVRAGQMRLEGKVRCA